MDIIPILFRFYSLSHLHLDSLLKRAKSIHQHLATSIDQGAKLLLGGYIRPLIVFHFKTASLYIKYLYPTTSSQLEKKEKENSTKVSSPLTRLLEHSQLETLPFPCPYYFLGLKNNIRTIYKMDWMRAARTDYRQEKSFPEEAVPKRLTTCRI